MNSAAMATTSRQSLQGSRVKQELEALREKQLAKNQRDKLKDRTYRFYCVDSILTCFCSFSLSLRCAVDHTGTSARLFGVHA